MIDTLAIVGTPIQWALIAGIAVLLFAPQLVPIFARILGRMMGREVQRRYGIRLRAAPTRRPSHQAISSPPEIEPRSDDPSENYVALEHLAPESADRPRSAAPVWAVSSVAAGLAAVLLWLLLHGR